MNLTPRSASNSIMIQHSSEPNRSCVLTQNRDGVGREYPKRTGPLLPLGQGCLVEASAWRQSLKVATPRPNAYNFVITCACRRRMPKLERPWFRSKLFGCGRYKLPAGRPRSKSNWLYLYPPSCSGEIVRTQDGKLLVARGADVNAKTDNGETPMDVSKTSTANYGRAETQGALRRLGGCCARSC